MKNKFENNDIKTRTIQFLPFANTINKSLRNNISPLEATGHAKHYKLVIGINDIQVLDLHVLHFSRYGFVQ